MGQQISLSDFKIPDLFATNNQKLNEPNETEDVHLFLPLDIISEINKNPILLHNHKVSNEISIAKETLINQIRNYISVFSNLSGFNEFNMEIAEIIKKMFDYISTTNTTLQNSMQSITNKQEQLKNSYDEKLKDDENEMAWIFSETLINSEKVSDEQQLRELSFFGVQSLITMLLMLLKSVHKSDSTIVHQMLNLTNQLAEQISLNSLSSNVYKRSDNLFKCLKPLNNYIQELSIQTEPDPIAANQSIKILLNFSVMQASFKDILPLIRKLIFNTNDVFDIRKLFVKLNKRLSMTIERFEKEKKTQSITTTTLQNTTDNNVITQDQNRIETLFLTKTTLDIEQRLLAAVEYLKLIEAYPNTQPITLNEKKFTGQFICSILLVHIDLHNQLHAKSQFERGSISGTFSFELEAQTFKYLYEIIEQLTIVQASSDTNLEYILNTCLRLFTTHLQFLISANFDNFHEFLNENDIEKWFTLITKLVLDDKLEERTKEASQALVYLIEKKTSSFSNMLTFIHKHIVENRHPILIDQLLNKVNQQVFIYKWIEILCDDQYTQDSALAYTVLHSLIEIVLKSAFIDIEKLNRLREIIIMFQELLLVYLNNQPVDISNELESSALSTLGIEYTTHIIKSCLKQDIQNVLFEPLLLGLCTLTDAKFNFAIIQPIFAAVMPLFAEYFIQTKINVDSKTNYLISWLLGKMSHRLIVGPQQSLLEKKYNTILKLPLFSGGYETLTTDINPYLSNLFKSDLTIYSRFLFPLRRQQSVLDNDFLITIYHNIDQGAQLISKMKLFIRNKQNMLQKSIEIIANDACAAVFAVYIKHYRRIDLARHELTQPIEQKPHAKLLVLYEYASEVRRIFATTKARGDDCHELRKKIKKDALLLLVSIREGSFIAKIKENFSLPIVTTNTFQLKRQQSHWTKAKHIIRLLLNTLNACIRLKYLMLEKKRAVEYKKDSESVMHRAIATCLYGNDLLTSVESGKLKIKSDEIVKCLIRQYQRAMTRLITYRFVEQLIITSKDNNRILHILFMNLKDNNLDWHYLESIQASGNQLKEDIGYLYYKIVKYILSDSMESNMKTLLILRVFNLINLNYDSMDLCLLNKFQFIQELFNPFISWIEIDTTSVEPMNMKLLAFNWFRLIILKLCENIELEELRNMHLGNRKFHHILQQQCNLIFNKLILTELKQLQQNKLTFEKECGDSSVKNASLRSFVSSSKFNVDICINQYLMLLLRCIHLYDHIRLNYATMDYIEQLFNLYLTSQSLDTRLLTLKILSDLLVCLPDDTNGTTNKSFIENLLTKILFSIGQNFNLLETKKIDHDIIIEFLYIYRMIMSYNSSWQKLATQLLIEAIKSCMDFNFTSLETVESKKMNCFLASICILGGYVHPYCLGSTVEIYPTDASIHELQSATIIEVNMDALESNSSDVRPYLIQYAATNQLEWISSTQMRIIVDVQPPNLSLLPIDNAVHTILDTLGFLAQINISTIDSLMLLDIKYRVVKALYDILNYKQVIEIFMQKPFASIIAQFSTSMDPLDSMCSTIPNDLRLFNQLHLEQYYLSLDRYARKNQIVENKLDIIHNKNGWNQKKIIRDPTILQYLSETSSIDEEWKPIASKSEIKSYKKGRLGNDDIRIISVPANDNLPALEECGIKHKFKGRVNITDDTGDIRYSSFILDEIELNEGKWYFCVKFPLGGEANIGWATKGFNPSLHNSYGIGDDAYSWGFNGAKGVYDRKQRSTFFSKKSWDEEAVCGCDIDIDGKNTNIKYWLNGRFLGTLFSHSENKTIESTIKTNLLPHGVFATYFPAVTIKVYRNVANTGVFEFIFSPEDMTECPLPKGYKPLLLPKLLTMENVLVAYPYSAYLIGNDIQQYFCTSRCSKNNSTDKKTSLLRDFVNNQHFEVPFNVDMIKTDEHLLTLSEENDGFVLLLDNHQSLTISFDFEIIVTDKTENCSDELDVVLFALDDAKFSIRICMNDNFIDDTMINRQHVAILFQTNEQTKVYINSKFHTLNYYHSFDPKTNSTLNLRLLPCLNAGIRNLGIWTYILSEEHIRRLFTYDLSYVAIDYQKLNEYKKQLNTIEFKAEQKYFANEKLVPFNEPFEQNLWEEIKQSINHDESSYFKAIPNSNQSVVQFFGNKTYLVLNTANQVWSEYSLILDIYIPNFPSAKNLSDSEARLTLLTLDDKSEICVTHNGHLHVTGGHQSLSTVKLQEYIRLLISVQQNSIHIYVNGSLELDVSITEDQFATKLKRIDLFRELDLTKNTTNNDQLRIECRSITYLNKSTHILSSSMKNLIQSTEYSLDQLVVPSFSILSASLIGIGYKEESIKYVMKKYNTKNIYVIDRILREETQYIENVYQQEQQQKRLDVLRRLNPYDENGTLYMLMNTDNITSDLSISTLRSEIVNNDDDDDNGDDMPSDKKWFNETVRSVGIHDKIDDWLRDKETNNQLTAEYPGYKLLDLTKTDSDETEFTNQFKKTVATSSHYVHRQISRKIYIHSRTICEYGLITIYARHSILNMLRVWCNDDPSSLFPLSKFGNENFIIKLLRFMDHHHTNARILIQASENYKFHDHIQNFLQHIFMETIVNETYSDSLALKFFRRPLMHLQLIRMEREKLLFSSLNEWPSFMKDLSITLDLINILTNKIQPYQWSELFFTESKEILGEKHTLTQEMVETAHIHFNRIADEQIMKFMNQNIKFNENSLSHEFVINFIETLPAESIPDSTKYASFTCLCNIPSVCIQTRVKFFYFLNIFLERTLSSIDFCVPSGIGFIVDRIRSVRHCILFVTKFEIFSAALDKTADGSELTEVDIKFDIIKASLAEHPEDTMFYQAYKQLNSNASRIFRRSSDEKVWKATYIGMFSDDQGGPYRDSITRICADLCSTRLPLFILCPNGRTNNGLNRDRWIPNVFPPNRSIPVAIQNQYRFVGQLMGMAIRTKQYLDVRFPILLWKQLIYEKVTIEDIEAIDISSFAIINQMEENIRQVKDLNECDDGDANNDYDYVFSSIMTELTFDVVSSTGQTYELIPGGFYIRITAANFEDYCMRYRQYRISEFHRQIHFIRQAHELEEAVCGKGYIDIEMLKRHTHYHKDHESSTRIQQFWSVLNEMFSEEQKKLFLIFVWGRSTLPYRDDDFSTNFMITRLETTGNVDKTLPSKFISIIDL
ncbi:unnamed protein product [Rotaria sp. Silwood2]|nr:unnamed protein product [Rotaria sp. Silwood2]